MRGLLATALLLGALSLAACSTIPVSGPVRTAVPQQERDDPAGFVPNGPADGATPADIVTGFVQAQGAGHGYGVAKQFLTPQEARAWRPNASVLVHTASWTLEAVEDDEVRLRVPVVAAVTPDGRYGPFERTQTLDFGLQRVRGQWRISDAPPGVVLSDRAFVSVFTSFKLQFFDPDYKRLVPDVRWLPVGGSTDAEVVRAVLGGQSPVLAQVTVPVFPAGTALAGPVRTADGVVTVAIRVPGALPDAQATNRMQQALAASLGPRSTSAVHLVVNGRQAPVAPRADVDQLSVAAPVVVSDGRFGSLTPAGSVSQDRELGPQVAKLQPRGVTVSARQRIAAVWTRDREVAVVDRRGVRAEDSRPGLIAPTLDQHGWTYSVPQDDPTGLQARDVNGRVVPLEDSLGGISVISIEVSTDGTRLLVLRQTDSGQEASVAGIVRSANGTPLGLTTDRYPIPLGGSETVGVTWLDQTDVAVLSQSGAGQTVTQQQVGGIAKTLGPLSNARSIVGATNPLDLRALLGTGDVAEWSGSVWEPGTSSTDDVSVLAVQR